MPLTTNDSNDSPDNRLPFEQVGQIAIKPPSESWMIQPLWGRSAVGFLFGQPKLGKSWLALDIAVSVASKTPCLGAFGVQDPGSVLIYLAEDALEDVRARVASLCVRRHLDILDLDLHVITVPTLRLDGPADQDKLRLTLELLRPRLLVLDPLVRLHALHENDASEMSRLLGYFRELQRTYDLAVMVIHHSRKRGASHAGQTLRGSSDFYAWTDVAACLTREGDRRLLLEVEHRSARSPDPIHLELHSRDDSPETYLRAIKTEADNCPFPAPSLEKRILQLLEDHETPQTNRQLREALQIQNSRVSQVLADLKKQGLVERQGKAGWTLVKSTTDCQDPEQGTLFES